MIKRTTFVILTTLLLFVTTQASAQQLWSKAEAGMTVEQVKQAFPEAIVPSDPSTLGSADRPKEGLRIRNLDVGGTPFRVKFYFAGGRLDQVTLNYTGESGFNVALSRYRTVNTLLRSKYGPEIDGKSNRGHMNREEHNYLSGDVNINNLMIGIGDDFTVWNINYQTRFKREADKL